MQIVLRTILEDGKVADKDFFDIDDNNLQDLDYYRWPKDLVHKWLFNPSFEIRAKAVEQGPTDISLIQKYISEETCRSNLFTLAEQNIFHSLPVSSQAELLNKCPEVVKRAYAYLEDDIDDWKGHLKEVSKLLSNTYARFYLNSKVGEDVKADSLTDFSDGLFVADYKGETFPIEIDMVVALLRSHLQGQGDPLEKQRVLEAMLHHQAPSIRAAVAELVSFSGHIKALTKDPCFSIRRKVIRNKNFEDANFTVAELLELICDDPELAEDVLLRIGDFQKRRLCERLVESNVLEIRSMALEELSQLNKNNLEDLLDEEDDDEEEEVLGDGEFDDFDE